MKNIDNRTVALTKAKFDIRPEDKTVHKGKTVVCISTGKVFKSAREAAKFYDVDYSTLTRVCTNDRGTTHIKGLKFAYVADLAYKVNDVTECIVELKAKADNTEKVTAEVARVMEILNRHKAETEELQATIIQLVG